MAARARAARPVTDPVRRAPRSGSARPAPGAGGRRAGRPGAVTLPAVSTQSTRAEALHLTGERTVPGVAEENYWFPTTRTLCAPW
ncbi:hypothetical protein CFN78_06990 [Amycolatopsis antarctica]|uniref:Uncharacterized protein n=1 Tax=Amycolatopsis antarctica TaxID=1854586 RepID=A0A263D906_9PSEU|nr:hypothetical protein CFN78_06990 [Amycolatopsis antarctica]